MQEVARKATRARVCSDASSLYCYGCRRVAGWSGQVQTAVIRYARSGETRIAYHVIGHGALD
jgi:hypothetical protein